MNDEKNWLLYYKNSLFDSENLAVDIARIKHLYRQNSSDLSAPQLSEKHATELVDNEERRINRLRGVTKKDSTHWYEITDTEILIAPFYLEHDSENTKFKQRIIHPFWIKARIDRKGQLSAPKDLFPLIVRNYLAPIADVKNDFIFSSIDAVSEAQLIETPEPEYEDETVGWDSYWSYVNEVFQTICYSSVYHYKTAKYFTRYKLTYFAVSSKISTAKSILFLYDNLLDAAPELPLLSKLITPEDRLRKDPVTDEGFLYYNHLHLGQMSNEFPLSISQRKTLLSYLTGEESPIMAVNGPPGTGKTTLLQSLVATEVVKAAIRGEDAPVILACSNNNQAVTNIIDSFINSVSTLEALSKRWIPDFNGYATYLPSGSKGDKALKDINYLKGNLFKHEGTLCELENHNYLYEAEQYFLEQYNSYFDIDETSLEDACVHLQEEIIAIEDQLIDSVKYSNDFLTGLKTLNNLLYHPEDQLPNAPIDIRTLHTIRTSLNELKAAKKSPDFLERVASYFCSNSGKPTATTKFRINEETLADADACFSYIKQQLANINLLQQADHKLKNWKSEHEIEGHPFTSETLMWEYEYEKIQERDFAPRFFYDEIDLKLRHTAFLLATHYWEARWILETMDALDGSSERGTGEKAVTTKWKRRAMLTPCFVATFYTAPSHFVYSQFRGESEEGKPLFDYLPLYNFIDLLIIDEAGQVTPEVSIPLFSLAQQAFVVGDLKQIEPIWAIPPRIDLGNLSTVDLLEDEHTFDELSRLGFLASNGSIMKMTQNACEYATPLDDKLENGLILLEHRRCNDEIIGFCNELAYGGILKPMKGTARDDQAFPSMIAYHVNGISERKYNSRCNLEEVKAIVLWLQQNKEVIQKAYGVAAIEEVLGIITPFASQKGELAKALTEAGYNINNIKLGTVHALQGAERSIILFSSVYSNEDEGTMFFDRDNKPNMLNVAVSRAKDSFILFGDTRVFDANQNTPSGLLRKHLNVYELTN